MSLGISPDSLFQIHKNVGETPRALTSGVSQTATCERISHRPPTNRENSTGRESRRHQLTARLLTSRETPAEHLTGTAGSASLGVTVFLRVADPLEPVVYPWVFKAEGSWSRSPNRIAAFTSTICLKAIQRLAQQCRRWYPSSSENMTTPCDLYDPFSMTEPRTWARLLSATCFVQRSLTPRTALLKSSFTARENCRFYS